MAQYPTGPIDIRHLTQINRSPFLPTTDRKRSSGNRTDGVGHKVEPAEHMLGGFSVLYAGLSRRRRSYYCAPDRTTSYVALGSRAPHART
jgi:hypothetical protein